MQPDKNITFYKVGGGVVNSLARFQTFITAAILQATLPQQGSAGTQVFVISAFGEITARIKAIIAVLSVSQKDQHALEIIFSEIELILEEIVGHKVTVQTAPLALEYLRNFWQIISELGSTTEIISEQQQAKLLQYGELISAQVVYRYVTCTHTSLTIKYLDSREIIKTSGTNPLEDVVDFKQTKIRFDEFFKELLSTHQNAIIITPGFISSAVETNHPTLLGFEGSDHTAAILAHTAMKCPVNFSSVELCYIKNVPGISLDFKEDDASTVFEEMITWGQVELLVNQGAKILHPKVIELLKSWSLLTVKVTSLESFTNPDYVGHKHTLIHQ